ncbi:MAG: rhomboid family intramembrane serine protease [Croceitalea sp.]|nr:rhomboid family intramembrane serine protease [Croceitalea sp.]NNM19296.1 rhomboid family intramembrane serine protease [Croceitalea sp.]
MAEHHHYKFTPGLLIVPLFAVLAIWTVYFIEIRFGLNFNDFGVLPRKLTGLKGIFSSPFIHGSLDHLYNNTIPLAILMAALFYFYRNIAWKVLLIGILLSGFLTWTIGRPSYHIGASGVIYVLASFIFFKGVFTKYYRLIALSLTIVFIYGSMLWYIFPVKDGISWEGHLSGFLTGLLLAKILKAKHPEPTKYAWEREDYNIEDDEFLRHFDENGNFIENLDTSSEDEITIVYNIKKNEKRD